MTHNTKVKALEYFELIFSNIKVNLFCLQGEEKHQRNQYNLQLKLKG